MDVGLAYALFSWFLHIDPACIVCNWDPATQSWIPAAGAGAGAAGAAGAGPWSSPPNPYYTPPPTHGGPPPNPYGEEPVNQFSPDSEVEDRVLSDEAEQQRQRDHARSRHGGEGTAGPPEPTVREQIEDVFYHVVITLGTRPPPR